MSWRNHLGIIIIVSLFIFANLLFLNFYSDVWWDSAVYLGMGKYIYSQGNSGLWESSRPLIFPTILGIGWKLDFDYVYFGRTVSLIFSILVLISVYSIGIKLFSKKIALLAVFFTAFSYTFFFFSSNILTGIPSTFFVLLAFYFFLQNRFFLMGLFSGAAVMTRFFQVFVLIGVILVFLIYFYNRKHFTKKLFYAAAGALLLVLPYFILNYYLYDDILLPFKIQNHLINTTGWILYEGFGFYFIGLLKENFFIVSLLSLPLFFRKNYKFYALTLIPFIYIIIFSFVSHKEMRFMLPILPFLYLLTSYCLFKIYNRIKYKKLALALFIVLIISWLAMTFSDFTDIYSYKTQRDDTGLMYFQYISALLA